MKTASFYRASAIRQHARAGCSVLWLAQKYNLAITTIEGILACRTIEGATKLLEIPVTYDVVKRFMLVEGRIVDFTALTGVDYD